MQFLPPTGPLAEEALTNAIELDVGGISARVFTAEHLAAIALQTGRAKDKKHACFSSLRPGRSTQPASNKSSPVTTWLIDGAGFNDSSSPRADSTFYFHRRMSFDFERIWKSKRALSERLAARPLAEKLRLLDALRARAIALRAAGSQPGVKVQEQPPPYGKP